MTKMKPYRQELSRARYLKQLMLLLLTMQVHWAFSTTWTYPGENQFKSAKYQVSVTQNGITKTSFVYQDANKNTSNLGSMTNFNHWTTFSFNGTVTIEVKKMTGTIGNVEIRPLSRNYQATVSGDKMTFTISKPEKLWIKMNGMYEDPLFIFADEPEVNAPTGPSANVVYWGPGVHNVGKHYKLKANTTYYLAGGAYLKGSFLSDNNADNVTVRGRGILSGENIAHCGYNECQFDRTAIRFQGTGSDNLEVEGITVINPAQYCLQAYGGDLETHNVKFFGWWFETDGWVAGHGTKLYDSFFKVYDDVVKLYFDNLHIHDLVIYKQHNGAPFQLGWSSESGNDNLVENIDIIYDETNWNQSGLEGNRGFISHANGNSSSTVQRMTFQNINFDEDISYLIGIKSQGTVKDFTLKNINVRGQQKYKSYMNGGNMSGFTLQNVNINGQCVNDDSDIDFKTNGNVAPINYQGCGTTNPVVDPVISFTDPVVNETINGIHQVTVNAYDEDFGTTHGDGITSVYFQLLKASDPSTAITFQEVTTFPFTWNLNTEDFENGDYELRAGVKSEDFNTTRKWTVVKPITINNTTTPTVDKMTTFSYPTANGQAFLSDKYDVYVKYGNQPEQKLQVLMSDVNYRTMYEGDWVSNALKGRTFSFVHLDYDKTGEGLRFRVVKKFGNNSSQAVVSPKSYGYTPTLTSGKELTFTMNDNNKYISVNFKGGDNVTSQYDWIKHMLCIFVDPPETGKPNLNSNGVVKYTNNVSSAALSNADVIYFPKGYHNLKNYNSNSPINNEGVLTIKDGQSVYLEGGAFIEGIIQRAAYQDKNQRVFGRGILTGRQYYWKNHPNHTGTLHGELIELGTDAEVKGIMYMESPNHGLVGRKIHVENVKFLGWHSNHDGVRVGEGSEIEHCFLRAVDDHFYNFNVHVHHTVLWAGHNGAILTYGWGGEANSNTYNSGGSIMEEIDIINPEWTGLGNNNGLIMSQVGLDYAPHDYGTGATTIMRNIRVEGSIPGITNLKARSSGAGNVAVQVNNADVGFLGDLILENITVEDQYSKGVIRGVANASYNGNAKWLVKDVVLKNVSIGGVCINENNKNDYFNIDNSTIQNVTFTCNGTTPFPTDISDLSATSSVVGQVSLSWGDVNHEDGYRIRRKEVGGTFIVVEDVVANTTSYTDVTAVAGQTYVYMVRPMQGGVATNVSNQPTVNVKENSTPVTGKPYIWIHTDMTAATGYQVSGNKAFAVTDADSDPDDHVALAMYLMQADKFNTVKIVLGSTTRNTSVNAKTFFDNTFRTAYANDIICLNNNGYSYPEADALDVVESSLTAGSGFRSFDDAPSNKYDNFNNLLPTVQDLVTELGKDKYTRENPLYVLVWGPMTEVAMAVKHLVRNNKTEELNRLHIISHWTTSFTNRQSENGCYTDGSSNAINFGVANCNQNCESCKYVREQAAVNSAVFRWTDVGSVGQTGIVNGSASFFSGGNSGVNGPQYNDFKKSKLGDLFVKSKFGFGKPDGSDCATFYALLGEYGVKLSDFNDNGVLTQAQENTAKNTFADNGFEIMDELMTISDIASSSCETPTCTTLRTAENPSNTVAGLAHEVFVLGETDVLPDFGQLVPSSQGLSTQFSIPSTVPEDEFGVVFKGFISIPTDGKYTFYTQSDDGSRILIGDETVVDHDGKHGCTEKPGEICLKAGVHAIEVQFFENALGECLTVSWSSDAIAKQEIPANKLFRVETTLPDTDQDGTPDVSDVCPTDPNKATSAGVCGCGQVDVDVDNDGICDTEDDDLDNDGILTVDDCDDSDPTVGLPQTWFADVDGDGLGDESDTQMACNQPTGYVEVSGDECPNDATNTCNEPQVENITDLETIVTSCNQVTLSWSDVPAEEGYRIRRKLVTETTFINLTDVPANTTDYTDNSVVENTAYVYMVRPLQNNVAVKISNTPQALIPECEAEDCAGVIGGTAYLDACQKCIGGTTGETSNDSDNDGVIDCEDQCPNDSEKTTPGTCGCGVVDVDMDNDGICDTEDDDLDNDGVVSSEDCDDTNPTIGLPTVWYEDVDGDGIGSSTSVQACEQPVGYVAINGDQCPNDSEKTTPGTCGCGVVDVDMDNDGICDTEDDDLDNDGVVSSEDCDDTNPTIGLPTVWYEDVDGDGIGSSTSVQACEQPVGYVAINGDQCPNDSEKTIPGECGCGVVEGTCVPTGNDCDVTLAYNPSTIYSTTGTKVIYQGKLYQNKWYITGTAPGGSNSPWELLGFCSAAPLDCSNTNSWSSSTAYSSPGTAVIYNGNMYTNQWYVQGNVPGESDAWTLEGPCDAASTAKLGSELYVEVYPNPFYEEMNITLDTPIETIEMIDAVGNRVDIEVVYTSLNSVQLNTSNVVAGNYIVKIQTNVGVAIRHVVKLD